MASLCGALKHGGLGDDTARTALVVSCRPPSCQRHDGPFRSSLDPDRISPPESGDTGADSDTKSSGFSFGASAPRTTNPRCCRLQHFRSRGDHLEAGEPPAQRIDRTQLNGGNPVGDRAADIFGTYNKALATSHQPGHRQNRKLSTFRQVNCVLKSDFLVLSTAWLTGGPGSNPPSMTTSSAPRSTTPSTSLVLTKLRNLSRYLLAVKCTCE